MPSPPYSRRSLTPFRWPQYRRRGQCRHQRHTCCVGKPGALAALKADTKAADEPKTADKTASQPQTNDKAQAATSHTDKDVVAHARGEEVQANGHRAASAEAPGTATTDTNAAAPKASADAAQTSALTAPSQNTALAATNATATPQLAPPATAAIPLAGVAIEIAVKAQAGTNHFEIRLDPSELGRIEVRLDVDKDGNVATRMIADDSDTLDLLRREGSSLERALQDASLKTADNLQFSLRDQSSQQQANNPDTTPLVVEDETPAPIEVLQRNYSRLAGQGSGIVIHV